MHIVMRETMTPAFNNIFAGKFITKLFLNNFDSIVNFHQNSESKQMNNFHLLSQLQVLLHVSIIYVH